MRRWTASPLGGSVLLGLAGLALQQVPFAYTVTFDGRLQHASLAHLHVGLLMAIALLSPDRRVFFGAGAVVLVGWCVRQGLADHGLTPALAWGVFAWGASMLWTQACARLAGWPGTAAGARVSRRQLPRLAAAVLVAHPLGLTLLACTSGVLQQAPGELVGAIFQTFFAKQFGVAVVTLPVVLAWTEMAHPQPPVRASRLLRLGWPVPLLAAMVFGWWSSHWLLQGFAARGISPQVMMDYRFAMFVVLAWLVARLPVRLGMLALSCGLMLLVMVSTRAATDGGTLPGFLNLLHIAMEVNILLVGMVYLWLGHRDRQALSRDLFEQTRRNSATGLPNLRALRADLRREPCADQALGYLLLDQAESVTSGYGIETQGEVMRRVAAHLAPAARAYNIGTGQFVLVRHPDAPSWEALMRGLEAAEFDIDGLRLRMSPYLGVAPLGQDGVEGLDAALRAASHLAFDARRRSDVLPRYAHASDVRQQDLQLRQLQDTGQALDSLRRRRIALHFQPIVPLHGRGHAADKLCGEVLCRLFDEDGTLIGPGRFMAPIEASGRGVELDLAVIRALQGELERHRDALPYCGRISVNLTGQSVASPSFRSELRALLAQWPLPLSSLCFEITETASIASTAAAIELLDELRAGGCRIAIDDFGTGMQSFARLKELPMDEIKIDGSFIRNVTREGPDQALVRASVAVARAFGAETVAEFVEDAATAQCLSAMGVDWVQGHFYGMPRPLADVLLSLVPPAPEPSGMVPA